MKNSAVISSRIREEVLRNSRYPVSQIADQLLPFLQILVDQFHPEQVILFGSYAYGQPTPDSDVDLLVVKDMERSPVSEATHIRRAVRHLRHSVANLPLDIMVRSPADWQQRLRDGGYFHTEIATKGLRIV